MANTASVETLQLGPVSRSVLSPEEWSELAARLNLSPREMQITQSIFDGLKETAIATNLGISTHTVHSHMERLYRKLDAHDHADVVLRVFATYRTADPRPSEPRP